MKKVLAFVSALLMMCMIVCPVFAQDAQGEEAKAMKGAYQSGNDFVMFIQAEDTEFVQMTTSGDWVVSDNAGALGGKTLECKKKASGITGNGLTVKFAVPADGEYSIWGRVCAPSHNSNSFFYSIDGGAQKIWDMCDEDEAVAPESYNAWHYFYLSERVKGTYSDTKQYGTWTIEHDEWRHSPARLTLTAGIHELKITGREAGAMLDEIVISSYSIAQYDPNFYEGNTNTISVCKFCGTDVHHYVADPFAKLGKSAEEYFTTVLHTDATAWKTDLEITFDEEGPGKNDGDNGNNNNNNNGSKPSGSDKTPADTGESQKPSVSKTTDTEAQTSEGEKKGCKSSLETGGVILLCVLGTSAIVATGTRRGKTGRRRK